MRNDRQGSSVRRMVSWGLVGAMFAMMPTATLAATDPPSAAPHSSLLAPSVVARAVASTSPSPARLSRALTAPNVTRDTAQAPTTSSKAFFKTGPGLMVIAVLAAGTGYAVYSAKHDRIRGSGR